MSDHDEELHDEVQRQLGEEQRLETFREEQDRLKRREEYQRNTARFVAEDDFQHYCNDFFHYHQLSGDERSNFWASFNVHFSDELWGRYYHERDEFRSFWRDYYQRRVREEAEKEAEQAARKVWAFSLTTPDKDAAAEVCEAAQKLFEQQSVPVAEGVAYLEYGKSGLPHIHGWYSTEHGGRVFAKVFKRCWPQWGEDRKHHTKFRGGYHELVKNPAAYTLYAAAEQRLVVRKEKSQPLVYGNPSSSSSSQAPSPQAHPPSDASDGST